MINLIGLSGRIGSGKDTVASMIQYLTEVHPYLIQLTFENYRTHSPCGPFQNKKFATKLKQMASLFTEYPVEKFEDQEFKMTVLPSIWDRTEDNIVRPMTVREFLQRLGTEAIRNNIHTNAWVNALFADYKSSFNENSVSDPYDPRSKTGGMEYPKWIISDCRFPNEAKAIKDRGGIIVRIVRNTSKDISSIDLHPSETALDNWEFDYVLNNNEDTLDKLLMKVELMLHHFKILKP